MEKTDPQLAKIKALIAFRAFFVTVLLGSFTFFEIGHWAFPYPKSVFNLIIALYSLTIVYALMLRKKVSPKPFAYFQIILDVFAVLSLIYFTGGIESWFSFLLILIVIASGTVIDKRAAFVTASIASILYGAMLDLQYWRMIPVPYGLVLFERDFLFNIFSNIVALYVCAYLTGQLSSSLEKTSITLEKKVTDFRKLSVFNKEILENMPSGLMTMDIDGNILSLNRAGESITGLDRDTANGMQIQDIFPFIKDLQKKSFARAEGEMAGGLVKKTIGLTISEIKSSQGEPAGFICIFSDLTEIKKMQNEMQLRQKWAAIGELSANIAHEIRNPLASLRGAVEMLHRGGTSPEQQESLMLMVLSEADRLNRIITDFLMYSRPAKTETEPVNLEALLKGTLEMLSKSAPEGVVIKTEIGPMRATADPGRLQQVFYNLVLNSFESMSAKGAGGLLTVTGKQENGSVEINFADTGQGISQEDAEKVFFPFFTTKDSGTGLGLSIALRIMEDHGGNIRFKSEPGRGTEFSVTLPANGKAQAYG